MWLYIGTVVSCAADQQAQNGWLDCYYICTDLFESDWVLTFTVFVAYHHDHTIDSSYTEHLNAIFQQ